MAEGPQGINTGMLESMKQASSSGIQGAGGLPSVEGAVNAGMQDQSGSSLAFNMEKISLGFPIEGGSLDALFPDGKGNDIFEMVLTAIDHHSPIGIQNSSEIGQGFMSTFGNTGLDNTALGSQLNAPRGPAGFINNNARQQGGH